jgi:predicted DNA-binding antitoxin AbrB/MazE fold protein
MRAIRAVYRNGTIKPLEPVDLPENTLLRVTVLDGDDLPPQALAKLAEAGEAFEFLNDPREDIYTELDGQAV